MTHPLLSARSDAAPFRTVPDWVTATDFVTAVALHGPWLIGDWLLAAETLGTKQDRTVALKADGRWDGSQVAEWTHMAERFPPRRRTHRLPWTFYRATVHLDRATGDELLARAARDGLTLTELRSAVRALRA